MAVSHVFFGSAAFAEEISPKREISERLIGQIDFSTRIKESFKTSPDGKRLAYLARQGDKTSVIVDGKTGNQYDRLSEIIFSPDSEHVAYGAKAGNKWFVVVDGEEGNQYDSISYLGGGGIVFESFDRLHYLAFKGSDLYLVEEKIK